MRPNIPIPQLRDMTGAVYDRLPELLRLVRTHGANVLTPANRHWGRFKGSLPLGDGRGANANNIKSSLTTLGLIDAAGLTTLGTAILSQRGAHKDEQIKRLIATRMLRDKHGWAFCYTLDVAGGQGREEIWEFYQEQFDADAPYHLMNITGFNKILQWLGVSDGQFALNKPRFEALLGVRLDQLRGLDGLHPDARLCLRALLTLDRSASHPGKDIQKAAFQLVGRAPNVHAMANHAIAVRDAGFVDYTYPGGDDNAINRGKHGRWRIRPGGVIDQLTTDFLQIYLSHDTDWDLAHVVQTSFGLLRSRLDSANADEAARALEYIAAKFCWRLGLRKIEVRWQSPGLEVDVIADRLEPNYQRFLVQCKHQASALGPAVMRKELGTAVVSKIENLIFVSTGGYTASARAFRREAMTETGKNILLLDAGDVDRICRNEAALSDVMKRENAFCRAVRGGDAAYWLPLQMQWLLPSAIAADGLTRADGERAWQALRALDVGVELGLKGLFLRLYDDGFDFLLRGEPWQMTLPLP